MIFKNVDLFPDDHLNFFQPLIFEFKDSHIKTREPKNGCRRWVAEGNIPRRMGSYGAGLTGWKILYDYNHRNTKTLVWYFDQKMVSNYFILPLLGNSKY